MGVHSLDGGVFAAWLLLQIVEKNHGFKIRMETQHEGLERWTVACMTWAQAEQLLEDLQQLGDVHAGTIMEISWEHVFDPVPIETDES